MTERLYWQDPLATSFETEGARASTLGDKPTLVLSRTLFYPEGGGQLGDAGTLAIGGASIAIADTQLDDEGTIHHVLAAPLDPEIAARLDGGVAVRGSLDAKRRRDHMVQHTAQHALSRALADHARADTVSARLGASTCTIDVSRPGILDADLHRVEDVVNGLTSSDVAVVASFPTPEELAKLELRKQPNAEKSARGVRVVTIEDFDVTPCGGTHVTRTGMIGQVRIVATEKYKGMLRITFHAGERALADARAKSHALGAAAAELTCGALDVPQAIGKLRAELKGMREKLEGARSELAILVAKGLKDALPEEAPGPHVVPVMRPNDDLSSLRVLAGELTKDPRIVALCASSDPGGGEVVVVVQRGDRAPFDCGAFVAQQAKARGGKGGGRKERAEGRFPRGTSLEVLAAAASASLMA